MPQWSARAVRFAKFHAVGAIGIVVQLAALAFFKSGLGLNSVLATGLAVETAILHNFVWHERWTWKSETGPRPWNEIARLIWRFHLGAGGVSLLTNMGLTGLLAEVFHIHYLLANLIAIVCAGLVNFLLNEFLVFRGQPRT